MAMEELEPQPKKPGIGPQWILLALVLGVMIITSVAFMQPISRARTAPTPTANAAEVTLEGARTESIAPTPSVTPTEPPSAEEVGYTDGIILCSSVLVLILLVGTLRETLRRRNLPGGHDE
ncbi:hypothetical protein JR338_11645 [Chloroflexota bacterium]|nr:hypothetical protein JR338_11645 [Chloroflexota bacterium]